MMLFRNLDGNSIVNTSKCDYIILEYDYSASNERMIHNLAIEYGKDLT